MTKHRSRQPDARAKSRLEIVHCDLAGPVDPISIDGFRYALSFTDDFSGQIMTYFLKQKSNTVEATGKYLADCAPYGKIKRLSSDNGTEFTSNEFEALMASNGIHHEKSAPYSPHQNGTAERTWKILFDMARCLLLEAKLPKYLWTYAVLAASYIRNRCYSCRLGKTPFEVFTGTKPNIKNMNIFGTTCYAYIQDKQKLDPRARKGTFVGFDKYSPAYFVYFNESRNIKRERCVTFSNKIESTRTISNENVDSDYHNPITPAVQIDAQEEENNIQHNGSNIECAANNENDTTSSNENSRYPQRQRRQPEHLKDYVIQEDLYNTINLNIDTRSRFVDIPHKYEDAISSSNSRKWKDAMDEEFKSLKENDTFTLTPLPSGKNVIDGRWVYTIKEGQKGNPIYKAR